MPVTIIDQQRRLREIARIRAGDQTQTDSGKTRPRKLDRFRITAKDEAYIAAAAEKYGGTVAPWVNPFDGSEQFEVYTTANALPVIVPPTEMAFSQSFELWTAGGCQRRCDGDVELLSSKPCLCDPDARECKLTTRLSVILHELPGLGVSRLESHGYYAAVELNGAVELVRQAFARGGAMLPARLLLDHRTVKRPGPNGRPVTYRFVVPVLDFALSLTALEPGGVGTVALPNAAPAITAAPPPFDPVPDGGDPPGPSDVAGQLTGPIETGARGPHVPIPATGRSPRKPPAGAATPAQAVEEGAGAADSAQTSAPVPAPEAAALGEIVDVELAEGDGDAMAAIAETIDGGINDALEGAGVSSRPLAQMVAIWCADAGIKADDDRHAFLAAFSEIAEPGHGYASAKAVPPEHVPMLRATLVRVKRGELELVLGDPPALRDAVGPVTRPGGTGVPPAGAHDGAWDENRWRNELANVAGVGPGKLFKYARDEAGRLGLEQPRAFGAINDPALVEACLVWLRGQAS